MSALIKNKNQQRPSSQVVGSEEAEKTAGDQIKPLDSKVAQDLVQIFKLLADETRLRILSYLIQQSELNVRTLCEHLGQSQPAVSHHLALLRVAGLIESRRDGKHNFYHIQPNRFQELLEMIFAVSPKFISPGEDFSDEPSSSAQRIHINDFVLSFSRDGEES